MHVVIRRYENAVSLFDLLSKREDDIREIITSVPGFRGYQIVRTSTGGFSVTTCDEKSGTDESNRRAAEWIRLNIPEEAIRPAIVEEGDTMFSWLAETSTRTPR